MKVVMVKDHRAATNGVDIKQFAKGQEYELRANMAKRFLARGLAVEKVPEPEKAPKPKKKRPAKPQVVVCMLSFWQETGPELGSLIPSLMGLADRIRAFDGAYEGTPNATPSSDPSIHDYLRNLCEQCGIPLDLVVPKSLYAGDVDKRRKMIAQAKRGADWVFPADADWVFFGDRAGAREHLGQTDSHCVSVPFFTPPLGDPKKEAVLAPHKWHLDLLGKTVQYPVFYRVVPGLRIEKRHWWYLAGSGKSTYSVVGGPPGMRRAEREPTPANLQIEHRCFYRDPSYCADRCEFYMRREGIVETTGIEP
jgi:hypothetical protein